MCHALGCDKPSDGVARLCRSPRSPAEPSWKGRVWGGWNYYCSDHLDELAASGEYLIHRDRNRLERR
jgi:hypothetical protein